MIAIPEVITARKEAERALLGALLIEGSCPTSTPMAEVAPIVCPTDFLDAQFHEGQHTRIFTAMLQCVHPHQIAVAQELNRTEQLQWGDCVYLSELVAEAISLEYVEFARIVAGYSRPLLKPKFQGGI